MKYAKLPSKSVYYTSFILLSIAPLWNFDTGIIAFIAWVLFLIYQELFNSDKKTAIKKILFHILNGIVILVGIVILFTLYSWLRYGNIPDFSSFFEYQKYFYHYGFFMIKMPIFHPWNLTILIYVMGLGYGIKNLINKNKSFESGFIMFLAILGFGIFSYYQGRSHNFCLAPVWYPAFIILAFFTDRLLEEVKKYNEYSSKVLFLAITFFYTSYFMSFFTNYQTLSKGLKELLNNLPEHKTEITERIEFIRKNTVYGEKVLILSYHSGILYLYSQTNLPISIPGLSEIILKKDYRTIENFLKSNKNIKVFVEKNFVNDKQYLHINPIEAKKQALIPLYNNYKLADSCKKCEIDLYIPKK